MMWVQTLLISIPLKLALCTGAAAMVAACSSPSDAAPPPQAVPLSGTLAFPGAVGHGALSQGGRGGKIYIVDTLADSGVGSLRNCIDANQPRVCVFRVGGLIRFVGRPPIIRNPYITIAGQTAPGGGITLAHSGTFGGRTPLLIKNSHDVVVRHLKVRLDRIGSNRQSEDAFTIENSENVILDHVSGSWARDELVNGYGDNDRITISNSIFGLGIPRHDKCALLGSDPKDPQRLSFIGNLCAHNGDRNPDINFPPGSCVEIINNVLYNAQSQFAEVWESFGGTPVAIIGNFFKAGPDTPMRAIGIARNEIGSTGRASIYLWGNDFDGSFQHVSGDAEQVTTPLPACPLTINAVSAAQAYDKVLARAGAFPRDEIDAKLVNDVRNSSGKIIREPGKIPAIDSGTAYLDVDRDGLDDNWEAQNGADPEKFDAWNDNNGDGITNLDEFLDMLHRKLLGDAGQ